MAARDGGPKGTGCLDEAHLLPVAVHMLAAGTPLCSDTGDPVKRNFAHRTMSNRVCCLDAHNDTHARGCPEVWCWNPASGNRQVLHAYILQKNCYVTPYDSAESRNLDADTPRAVFAPVLPVCVNYPETPWHADIPGLNMVNRLALVISQDLPGGGIRYTVAPKLICSDLLAVFRAVLPDGAAPFDADRVQQLLREIGPSRFDGHEREPLLLPVLQPLSGFLRAFRGAVFPICASWLPFLLPEQPLLPRPDELLPAPPCFAHLRQQLPVLPHLLPQTPPVPVLEHAPIPPHALEHPGQIDAESDSANTGRDHNAAECSAYIPEERIVEDSPDPARVPEYIPMHDRKDRE